MGRANAVLLLLLLLPEGSEAAALQQAPGSSGKRIRRAGRQIANPPSRLIVDILEEGGLGSLGR